MKIRVVEETLDVSTMGHWDNIKQARVKRDVQKQRAQIQQREYKRFGKLVSLADARDVEASSLVLERDAADKIISTIKKENPYLAVIDSNRLKLKGLSKTTALGSVAEKLGEKSTCPVLLVK